MHMSLQRQFDMLVIYFQFLCPFHVSDHIIEYLDLIYANLDSLANKLCRLVSLFIPAVTHDLF